MSQLCNLLHSSSFSGHSSKIDNYHHSLIIPVAKRIYLFITIQQQLRNILGDRHLH